MTAQRKLVDPGYLSFPFRMSPGGPAVSRRRAHVREQIEQVLFTNPGERIFRPSFGAGLRAMVFEPASAGFRDTVRKRIAASLQEALRGEVDPRTLAIDIVTADERLIITVSYTLATTGRPETHDFSLTAGGTDG